MKKKIIAAGLALMSLSVVAEDNIEKIIANHLQKYGQQEYFSGIAVSVKAGSDYHHYAVGKQGHDATSAPLTTQSLFDIGSITKSFTAAMAVLAETDQRLQLDQPLGSVLKEYPQWQNLTLTSLLDMSTGIPNYSDPPTINYLFSKDIKQFWTQTDLLALAYPKALNPPLKPGYFYSNTGYVLMDLILTKLYQKPYKEQLEEKIIKPLNLTHTYYPVPAYPEDLIARMARGYSFNIYDNPELLAKDVTENNLSWAGAAGALVSNSEDVVHWVEALFINDKILNASQKARMQRLISTTTGKAITQVDKNDAHAFGLGLVNALDESIGTFWFYEGKTLGYRAVYMYVPCNKVIIVTLFNSATNSENDHSSELIKGIYQELLNANKSLACAAA